MEETKEVKSENESIVIEGSMIFEKNPEVSIREEMEEDGRYILFNAENEVILVINSTGKFILESCDGEKTVDQIVKEIEQQYTLPEGIDLLEVVKSYMSTLLKPELIKERGGN